MTDVGRPEGPETAEQICSLGCEHRQHRRRVRLASVGLALELVVGRGHQILHLRRGAGTAVWPYAEMVMTIGSAAGSVGASEGDLVRCGRRDG
jgi:hypothetical protein